MKNPATYTSFSGYKHLTTDSLLNVTLAIKNMENNIDSVLIFNDQTGQQIDVDLSGSVLDIQNRYSAINTSTIETVKKVGRPKLGVISREITLQQKHWDWLDQQSTSASAVIRKLIDQELNNPKSESNIMLAKQAIDRFMSAMLGDLPNYEEATRALYQGNKANFYSNIKDYPQDIKAYLNLLAQHVF